MNQYKEFLKYLDRLQETKIKPGIERTMHICRRLGNPEKDFKSIHVAGTNGKGSTAVFLESILRNNDYKVGLFTSPHLTDVRERIQIDREPISKEVISELYVHVREKSLGIDLSYFEFLTALAFLYFSKKCVDFAVIEAGLGGRWDSTSVIEPLVSVITPISIDHTNFLGANLVSIAIEKCGVIKPEIPVISATQEKRVEALIREFADEFDSPLYFSKPHKDLQKIGLAGDHQIQNASLAIDAAEHIRRSGYKVKGLKKAVAHVDWPGRLQKISDDPPIIVDGAHNVASCHALANYLGSNFSDRDIVFVFGAKKDKDIKAMVKEFKGVSSGWVVLPLEGKRAASAKEIKKAIPDKVKIASDKKDAVEKALSFGFEDPLIVVAGSLYLVGKFLNG